jgi:hypothetical protein
MFRKLMTLTAVVSLVVLSACSSTTGLKTGGDTGHRARGGGGPKPPQQFEKVCLEDLRAVEITSPSEGSIVYGGEIAMVTWEAREICGHFAAELEVSLDGGRTFVSKGEYKDATSASWKVPNVDGAQVVVRVSLRDRIGEVSDDMAFANRLVGRHTGRARNPQDNLPE